MSTSVSLFNFFRKYLLKNNFYIFYNGDKRNANYYSPVYEGKHPYKYYIPLEKSIQGYFRIVVSSNAAKYIEKLSGNIDLTRLRVKFMPWPEIVYVSDKYHNSEYHKENDNWHNFTITYTIKGNYLYHNHIPLYSSLNYLGIKVKYDYIQEQPANSVCHTFNVYNNFRGKIGDVAILKIDEDKINTLLNIFPIELSRCAKENKIGPNLTNLFIELDCNYNLHIGSVVDYIRSVYNDEGELIDEIFRRKKGREYFLLQEDSMDTLTQEIIGIIKNIDVLLAFRKRTQIFLSEISSFLNKQRKYDVIYLLVTFNSIVGYIPDEDMDEEEVIAQIIKNTDCRVVYSYMAFLIKDFYIYEELSEEEEQWAAWTLPSPPKLDKTKIEEAINRLWLEIIESVSEFSSETKSIIRRYLKFWY